MDSSMFDGRMFEGWMPFSAARIIYSGFFEGLVDAGWWCSLAKSSRQDQFECAHSAAMATPTADQVPATSRSSHETSSVMTRILSWLSRYRFVEFSISVGLLIVTALLSLLPVNKREIPSVEVRISQTQVVYARDPTINNKKLHEQVSVVALVVGTTLIPIAVNLFINFVLPKIKIVRVIPHDTRDFLLSLLQSVGISQVLTQFIKNLTGRFRPSFYDMCKWNYDVVWDGKTNLCQDEKWEKEARLSFPSGHASYAWCTLFLMTLYLLGRSRLNCENRDETMLRGGLKTLKLFLCFLPTIGAMWVAITRSVDNWHHYADIVAGSILGALAAGFSYNYNYGSIFHWESAGLTLQELHVRRQKKDQELRELVSHSSAPVKLDLHPQSIIHSNASHMTTVPVISSGDRIESIAISIK